MSYTVVFYEDKNGNSKLIDTIVQLKDKGKTSKDARIQCQQIINYIDLLAENGLDLPTIMLKHIEKDIWELRPGNNRILLFSYVDGTFVLLHMFRKKTQKTPEREIKRARNERESWISRVGDKK